jgi:predicted AlkP superfamily phosphohydrolase/phosphomutase
MSPKIGEVRGTYDGHRSGDHRPTGLVFARGPGIEAGRLPGPISVIDLAPTIMTLLGTELPGAEGNPIPSLVHGHT